MLARPAGIASDSVSVRQVAVLLHASFRRRLTTTPLRFANPSPPSGWIEDFHLQAVEYARHTTESPGFGPGLISVGGGFRLERLLSSPQQPDTG